MKLIILFGCLLVIVGVIVIIGNIFMMIKSDVTFRQRAKILTAIHRYHKHLIWEGLYETGHNLVEYDDVEPYDDTYHRLWDWGYKRILPKEKYEIIKQFIEEKKK